MQQYFRFLDLYNSIDGCFMYNSIPELMIAFEIPKYEAQRVLQEWYERNRQELQENIRFERKIAEY